MKVIAQLRREADSRLVRHLMFTVTMALLSTPSTMHAGEATFDRTPNANVATTPGRDYRLGAEDVIEVFVWKEPDLSSTVVVRPDGKVSLPLAGELEVSGKTATQIQRDVADRLQRYVSQPIVNVMVKQINSLKISVLGEVRKPDVYRIKNRVTVLDAMAMAGGFTDLARPTRVVVLRNSAQGEQRIRLNLKAEVADVTAAPFYLEPLDTVYVEGR